MSRLSPALLGIILIGQLAIQSGRGELRVGSSSSSSAPALSASSTPQKAQQRGRPPTADIDLIELTPNMELQLYQAKRLNRGDQSDSSSLLAEDAYRYELGAGPANSRSDWLERALLAGQSLKRRASIPASNRISRGLHRYDEAAADQAGAPPYLVDGQDEEDKDFAFIELPTTTADNHESAARDSLWTSDQLRDLLIAQEARNRAKNLEHLLRVIARQRANKNAGGGGPLDGRPVEVAEIREKRRRCKVDPNLGVKNPSFCDTDAYFGAADYSMRDVWDSAGRRR